MRRALDIFLTINLIAVTGYLFYLWQIGDLKIGFSESETIAAPVDRSVYLVFADTLRTEVDNELGQPIEGYEPAMLMRVFPGLAISDFTGVESTIGHYKIKDGQLEHFIPQGTLVHSAAGAINRRGFDTLLDNVAARLSVDLRASGTITEIMNAIAD